MCPENHYSHGGSFIIKGEQSEWTEDTLKQFKNKCFSYDIKGQLKPSCKAFTSNGNFITTNNAYNVDQYEYAAQLSFKVTIVTKGELRFQYQKGFAIEKNLITGIFRLIVNYISVYEDFNNKVDWIEYSLPLEPGQYSIMFFYVKYVLSDQTKQLTLKIKSIKVKGTETAALKCLPCIGGTSKPGSNYCNYCNEGKYFDETTQQCLKCPIGTNSKYKSIGKESCQEIPACTENSYQRIVSPLCNKTTNQQKVHYELIQTNCNEVNAPLDSTFECNDCPPGNYWSEISLDNENLKCMPCPKGKYTSKSNQYFCLPCEGVLSKIVYLTPDDETKWNKMNFDIEIETFEGEMQFSFNQIDNSQPFKIDILIDKTMIKYISSHNKNERIKLGVGAHSIQITSTNAIITMVSISNTKTGGGYNCSPCSNGFLIKKNEELICQKCGAGFELNQKEDCTACPEGYYKYSNDHFDKCIKCPIMTISNESKNGCEPFKVMTNSKYKTKIHLSKYEQTKNYLCRITNNLCTDEFYGPIRDNEKNLYFVSYNKANVFKNEAFSYKFNEQIANAFVYQLTNESNSALVNSSVPKSKNDQIFNSKVVVNLGKEVSSIKIMNGKVNKGIAITYANGDMCKDNPDKRYQSVFLFKCFHKEEVLDDSAFEVMMEAYSPKFITKSKCTFYFEWSSRNACPICLSSQVKRISMPCKGFSRYVYFTEIDNCIISNTTDLSGNSQEETDDKSMIDNNTETNAGLLSAYDITDTFNELKQQGINKGSDEDNDDEYYIQSTRIQETCYMYDDFDIKILIVIIAIPIVYLIIALIFIRICCKYCKIRNDYHRLVEEPVATENLNNSNVNSNRINQQIELGSYVNTNKKS